MGHATTVQELAALRFVTGLGVGGSLPNLLALASQLSPRRHRASLVSMTGCGFPVGATFAGLLTTWLLDGHGWRNVYLAAGVFPLLLTPVLLALLPDSIPCLLRRKDGQLGAVTTVRRLYPGLPSDCHVGWSDAQARVAKLPLVTIFQHGRALLSVLLTGIFFFSLMNVYFLANWLPELLQRGHSTPHEALIATTVFNVGGIAGALLVGRLIDAFGYMRVLGTCFVLGSASMFGLANGHFSFDVLLAAAFAGGFLVLGGQGALNALPSLLYPADQRSTATGWAVGTGRLGSVLGPAVAGLLLSVHWSHAQVLMLAALLPLLAASLLRFVARHPPQSGARSGHDTMPG
jgi:AAHS family 4-hydroxybenzoate transporter-like MFS transporter